VPGPESSEPEAPRGAARHTAVILVLLGATGLHALAFLNLPLIPKNDSVWYLGLSHGLAAERIFDPYALGAPTSFDIHYTIGYPLFLDLVRWLVGWQHLALGVLVAQHLAGIATVWLVWRLGVELGRPGAGTLAAAAYALSFPALYYSQLMISETLFTSLALTAAVLLVRWFTGPSTRRLVACGALLGLASLVRPIAVVELAAFAAFVVLHTGLGSLRTGARRLAILASPTVLMLGLALAHNHVTYGRASLSDATGRHLIDRVWAFDGEVASDAPHTRQVLDFCRASGQRFRIPGLWWDSYKALRYGSGTTAREADDLLRSAAWESIRARPWSYLAKTPVAAWHVLSDADTWPPALEQTLSPAAFERYLTIWTRAPAERRAVSRSSRAIEGRRELRRRMPISSPEGGPQQRWWLVFWRDHSPRYGTGMAVAALVGALVLLRFGRRPDWVPVLVFLALVLPAAFLEYPYPRYRQPAIPAMLVVIASAAWEALRRIRPRARAAAAGP